MDLSSDAENPFAKIRAWMVLVLYCYSVVAGDLFVNVLMAMEKSPWRSLASSFCWRSLLFLCLLGIAKHQGVDLRRLVGPNPSRTQFLTSSVVLLPLVLLFFVGAWAINTARSWFPMLPPLSSSLGESYWRFGEPLRLVQLVEWISAIGYAPIFEEFVFRGIILNRLVVKFGARAGLIASSLFFGSVHFDNRMPGATCAGLFFGLLYLKTQSLPFCVALHACVNATGVLLPATGLVTVPHEAGPILGMFAIPWFFLYAKRNWPASSCTAPYFSRAELG